MQLQQSYRKIISSVAAVGKRWRKYREYKRKWHPCEQVYKFKRYHELGEVSWHATTSHDDFPESRQRLILLHRERKHFRCDALYTPFLLLSSSNHHKWTWLALEPFSIISVCKAFLVQGVIILQPHGENHSSSHIRFPPHDSFLLHYKSYASRTLLVLNKHYEEIRLCGME